MSDSQAQTALSNGVSTSSRPDHTAAAEAFTGQARWLIEWHNKRSGGFEARAVAILGFTGVILALLPAGLGTSKWLQVTTAIRWTMLTIAILLVVTAFCCLMTLRPQAACAPKVEEWRLRWRGYPTLAYVEGQTQADVAESLLRGQSVLADSPVDFAAKEANTRGRWFAFTLYPLLAALVALAALVVQVFWQL